MSFYLSATIEFPGDIDLIAPDAEPAKGRLVLRGEKLNGSEVFADGHRIGKAFAVDKQTYEMLYANTVQYADTVRPEGALIATTTLVMQLEVPLPVDLDDIPDRVRGKVENQHDNEQVRRLRREGRCPTCGAEA